MFANVRRHSELARTIKASSAITATGAGDAVSLPDAPNGFAFVLDVTAAATAANDTLDVQIQTKLDGTNWVPVVSFTQVAGNGGAVRHVAKISSDGAQAMFEDSATLSAGSIRNLVGDSWRAAWTVVENDAASFTFSVTAIPM